MTRKALQIYFAGAIRAGRADAVLYAALISELKAFGAVLTEHVGDPALSEAGGDGPDDRHIHDRDMAWLRNCDCVVAEVSTPSLGVGYELAWATALEKPVLCLYRKTPGRPLSAMIAGSPGISTDSYTSLAEAKTIVREFVGPFAENGPAPPRTAVSRKPGRMK